MSTTSTVRLSRRQLLACGFVLAGAGTLAPPATAAAAVSDGMLLRYALQVEQLSVVAYQHALGLSGAEGAVRTRLTEFLSHEQLHISVLERELRSLGEALPSPIASIASANALLSQHGLSRDIGATTKLHDAISLLLDIEGLSQGAYHAMAGLLRSSAPLLPAVEALGCEAQHQALLTDIQYPGKIERSVPGPFVEGWQ
jgi:hypothetical protein